MGLDPQRDFNYDRTHQLEDRLLPEMITAGEVYNEGRFGYSLARLALAYFRAGPFVNEPFKKYAGLAFDRLAGDQAANQIPPLPQDLVETIRKYQADNGYASDVAAWLLVQAVDHGSRETFTASDHDAVLHPPQPYN